MAASTSVMNATDVLVSISTDGGIDLHGHRKGYKRRLERNDGHP
jgi:hypothetical protein